MLRNTLYVFFVLIHNPRAPYSFPIIFILGDDGSEERFIGDTTEVLCRIWSTRDRSDDAVDIRSQRKIREKTELVITIKS